MPKENKKILSPDEQFMGALSYLWGLCLLPLLNKKDSEFCQFHAKQGFVLFWGSFVVIFLGMIPFMVGNIFLSVGWLLVWCILFVIASLLGLISVWRGKMGEIPFIGDYAKKINL